MALHVLTLSILVASITFVGGSRNPLRSLEECCALDLSCSETATSIGGINKDNFSLRDLRQANKISDPGTNLNELARFFNAKRVFVQLNTRISSTTQLDDG